MHISKHGVLFPINSYNSKNQKLAFSIYIYLNNMKYLYIIVGHLYLFIIDCQFIFFLSIFIAVEFYSSDHSAHYGIHSVISTAFPEHPALLPQDRPASPHRVLHALHTYARCAHICTGCTHMHRVRMLLLPPHIILTNLPTFRSKITPSFSSSVYK